MMKITHRNIKRFLEGGASCIALLLLSHVGYGQAIDGSRPVRDDARRNPSYETSGLGKENLDRVAASAVQIKEVLVKDAGLLVELKRWIAKEATDSGQVVEDSRLTDDAVFDRLNRDLAFRAVATRLLQRYGYFTPSPNPDSSFGKQEDLLLKERARRLVQIESQEDSEPTQSKKGGTNNQDLERTTTCDPRQDEDCEKQGTTSNRRSNRPPSNQAPTPDENPGTMPGDGSPSYSPNSPRTLRTQSNPDEQETVPRGRMSSPEIELASSSPKAGSDYSAYPPSIPSTPNGLSLPRETASEADRSSSRESSPSQLARPKRSKNQVYEEEDVTPVKMVHRANPYSDIPSLYDMYVQAAAWQRPAERFGSEIFRNTINQPDVIPMDLPVGPDYVVGTGDSLSIDLWGSVSQRLVRLSIGKEESRFRRRARAGDRQDPQRCATGSSTRSSDAIQQHFRRCVAFTGLGQCGFMWSEKSLQPAAYDISSLSTPSECPLRRRRSDGTRLAARPQTRIAVINGLRKLTRYDLLLHGIRARFAAAGKWRHASHTADWTATHG